MEVRLAKTAGFCFGVKRAVDTVYKEAERTDGKTVYTYGPIIHNQEVVKDLAKKGVKVLEDEVALDALEDGVVVIRSHGVPRSICDKLDAKAIPYVDATCPFVKKIHRIVETESEKGSYIIIIGNPDHPEVMGIKGWAKGPVSVIQTKEEAKTFAEKTEVSATSENGACTKFTIVAQTTFNFNKFKELVEIMSEKLYDISVLNTICSATKERQEEAGRIAREVDAMIVIGDKHSSNTQKLFEICDNACNNTYYIQTLDDFDMNQLRSVDTVGITAGASTPNKIIEEVQNYVRINF